MKIFITGGTGFTGTYLAKRLLDSGHQVIVTGTRPHNRSARPGLEYVVADTSKPGLWQDMVRDTDAVVNLAGRTIFRYWTSAYKEEMYASRIMTTRHLVDALPSDRNIVLCSTSAAGYYGDRKDEILTEAAEPGHDFLAKLAGDWEAEALRAREKAVRVVIMRFGIVLGKGGGAMQQMLPAFRMGLGGRLGNGKQWFPWIHLDDLASAVLFCIENAEAEGAFNFTAPAPVRNRDFARILGRVLRRPAILPAPGVMLRTIMGELGKTLLASQRAVPQQLEKAGFCFKYPELRSALEEITG